VVLSLTNRKLAGGEERRESIYSWILSGPHCGVVLTVVLVGTLGVAVDWIWFLGADGMLRGGRTQINVGQPTVVRQLQQLQRLETVSYTMDKIIRVSTPMTYLPKISGW